MARTARHVGEAQHDRGQRDNVFIQHDLNIYNFIIQINALLGASARKIEPRPLRMIDLSAIDDVDHRLAVRPDTKAAKDESK